MLEAADAGQLTGTTITGASGERLGTITELRTDPDSGVPAWVRVDIGYSNGRDAVVPLMSARKTRHGDPWVPYTKAQLLSAPYVASLDGLDTGHERSLLAHYGTPDEGSEAAAADGRRLAAAATRTPDGPDAPGGSDGSGGSGGPGRTTGAPGAVVDDGPGPRAAARHRSPRSDRRSVVLTAAGGVALVVVLAVLRRRARPLPPLRKVRSLR